MYILTSSLCVFACSRAVESQDFKGDTPLHLAASISNYHCLQLLLTKRPNFSAGKYLSVRCCFADVRVFPLIPPSANNAGQTALDLAEEEENEECIHLVSNSITRWFEKLKVLVFDCLE